MAWRLPAHPSFSTRRRERFCRQAPNTLRAFFTYIVHAAGHRPHTAITFLPGTFMHPHSAQDGWPGQCKTPVGNHGCLTHRQKHETRQLPLWRVVGTSRCLRLVSAPPSSVGAPSTTDPLPTDPLTADRPGFNGLRPVVVYTGGGTFGV
jgi:hypothetical protein